MLLSCEIEVSRGTGAQVQIQRSKTSFSKNSVEFKLS